MPEIYIHQTPDVYIRVWEITEPESFFETAISGKLLDQSRNYQEIKAPSNRLQYLASRKLIADCFPHSEPFTLKRKESRQLYIHELPDSCFSITHTEGYAAIITSKQPCGIDLETLDRDVSRIKHKFMRDDELDLFHQPKEALKVWSAKECIFKIFGHGDVDFLQHIYIRPAEHGMLHGRFQNAIVNFESFISIKTLKNIQLVWGVGIKLVQL